MGSLRHGLMTLMMKTYGNWIEIIFSPFDVIDQQSESKKQKEARHDIHS